MTSVTQAVQTLAYDSASQSLMPTATWDILFNNDAANCGITSCSLYNGGSCGTGTFSGTEITMGASNPWDLVAQRNILGGYSYIICVRCTNG
jgi:hypothetical protein